MTTPTGQISFEDIRTEFGRPQANNEFGEYYSGGNALGAPLANVPSSGAISMSQLRNTAKSGVFRFWDFGTHFSLTRLA